MTTRRDQSLATLRAHAVERSLFAATTLAAAIDRLGFVQADPIRSPACAQDLILRHRVRGYRAGELERRYPKLALEEDLFYAYGFLPRSVWRLLHAPNTRRMTRLETNVLGAVRERGEIHPRQLDAEFGRRRVTNAWGGSSTATKHALETLHRRGLLRVARRDKGIRVYAPVDAGDDGARPIDRFRALVMVAANIFAPSPRARLLSTLSPRRRRWQIDLRTAHAVVDGLVTDGKLAQRDVDGVTYVWPRAGSPRRRGRRIVRFLAPFDPVVWDRERFEHLWAWPYRFEAYTPAAKRVRGYYAMPLLWGTDVIGWANVSAAGDELDVDVGFVDARPRDKTFAIELEAEIERMRVFLRARGG